MRAKFLWLASALMLVLPGLHSGCSHLAELRAPLSPQEELITDVWPILNDTRRSEIRRLTSYEQVQVYLDDFWKEMDPTPGGEVNEYRAEYESRLDYVRAHYPYQKGWTFEDRARVYLIYGPPDDIYFDPWILEAQNRRAEMKAIEIWVYDIMIATNHPATIFDVIDPLLVKFVFADFAYADRYTQVYSNVPGEQIDPTVYRLSGE